MTSSTQMTAGEHQVVACLGGDQTAMETRPVPDPGEGELLLKLRVVGFCGTDLFKLDTGTVTPGMVLGHEVVGEVVAKGGGTDAFREGDRIAVPHHVPCGECTLCRRGNETMCETFRENLMEPGGFADHILIRPRATALAAHRVPEGLGDDQAVFVEPGACVMRGVDRSGIEAGGTAVVQGGGSMGLLHLLTLLAAVDDVSVVVIDPVEERQVMAKNLGATASAAPGAAARETVMAVSGGLGADAVFDTVGGNSPLQAALSLSRQGGSVVLFAHAPDGQRADFDLNDLFKYERRILGTYSGALNEQKTVFDLMVAGRLDPAPLVTHRLPLDDFQDGVRLVRERKALKVLFTPSRSGRGA